MNYRLSLPYSSFSGVSEAFMFINEFIVFKVAGLLTQNSKGWMEYDYNKIVQYLDESKTDSFNLVNNFSDYLDFNNSITFRRSNLLQMNLFSFSVQSPNDLKFEELLASVAKRDFTMMLQFDFSKAKWQSERLIDNYKAFNRKFDHLPKIWDDKLSPILGEVIDISKNPGHFIETFGIILMASPEMWFGPASWAFFAKAKLMSFPNAMEIKEILPDVVYVKLFDPYEDDYEKSDILNIQMKFREWTKMDRIEELLNKKVSNPTNAAIINLEIDDLKNIEENMNIIDLTKSKRRKNLK